MNNIFEFRALLFANHSKSSFNVIYRCFCFFASFSFPNNFFFTRNNVFYLSEGRMLWSSLLIRHFFLQLPQSMIERGNYVWVLFVLVLFLSIILSEFVNVIYIVIIGWTWNIVLMNMKFLVQNRNLTIRISSLNSNNGLRVNPFASFMENSSYWSTFSFFSWFVLAYGVFLWYYVFLDQRSYSASNC